MKTIKQVLHLLTAFLLINSYGQVEVTNYGDIPLDRLAISRWQNFKWDGSGSWETIDVTTKGILPNKTNDIAPLVNSLINNGSGKRILKFPAGTFNIKSGLNISKGDIQIVGAGSATKFLLAGGANPGSISANGGRGSFYSLTKDANRGDTTISLTSSTGFNVGDYFILVQPGSAVRPGASGDDTQIFRITAKSGNVVTLDFKVGIPFMKSASSIQKLTPKQNLRFHNFYIEMTTKPTPSGGKHTNISLNTVQNVEFSNIESNKALTGHITVFRGREVSMHDNNVYGNYGGGGSFQYGFTLNFSTNCHIINNIASNLRHHYVLQFGTNHSVIAYNRALPGYNDYADYGQHNSKGCHNNLFEGNYGEELFDDANPLKSWGSRYSMWYRNYALVKIGSENEYVEYMNIIGNELKANASGIKKGAPGKFTFAGANIVSINGEGGTGTMVWGDLNAQSNLPASLFLKDRPSYVARWPLYGPQVTNTSPNNPPVVSFALPTITTFTAPATLIFKVNATDNDQGDSIENVKLYKNGTLVRQENVATYDWNHTGQDPALQNLVAGTYTFKAVATDSKGATGEKSITITVTSTTNPCTGVANPLVSIVSPTNNTNFNQGQNVTITANTSSSVAITKVEFYDGTTLVGTDTSSPYSYSSSSLNVGNHSFTAKAFNNCDKTATSTGVTVKINSVVVTPQGDISGPSCGSPLQSIVYQVSPALKVNATSYNWFFRGAKESLTVSADGTTCTVVSTKGNGEICVGIRYSSGTSYVEYCKTITNCNAKIIQEKALTVYPNPSKDGQFNLALKTANKVSITVFDMLGNKIYNAFFNNNTEISKEIDLSKAEKGMYFLHVEYDGILEVTNLIIE